MDTLFPFGFPAATALYLTLYVVTLVLHVALMNYVLAGSGLVAADAVAGKGGSRAAHMIKDWLPFGLGAAITAGVAPLLFVQILYQRQFYTANLLLFNRWMAIVPVLIVGFYLLYIMKTERAAAWPAPWRAALPLGAWLCFAFTGYSWAENHLLGLAEAQWAGFYAARSVVYWTADLPPRLALWFAGAVPTMSVMVAWQLWLARRDGEAIPPDEDRRISLVALCGIAASLACGVWYYAALGSGARGRLTGPLAGPYFALALLGLSAQVAAWWAQWRRVRLGAGWLGTASAGAAATILGLTVVREALRLHAVDIPALYESHARASAVAGLPLFLLFLAVNAGIVAWCLRLVRREVARRAK